MRFLFLTLAIVVSLSATVRVERVPILLIKKNGETVYCKEVLSGKFILTFVHSVEKTTVYELYEIEDDGTLHLYESWYSSLGAGLPSDIEGGFEIEDGFFKVRVSRVFKEISLRVSHLDGHGLIFEDGSNLMFKDIAEVNELLTISSTVLRSKFE
ncbi:DUF1850 domain-containing protein [Pseudothermotoga sp. U03pept]|uniref:DUF1850 domain-containing protein n=1 Tax=Pseudothermotoga sp. U03pept TaxID=3447012 RepID=UPI003F11D5C2